MIAPLGYGTQAFLHKWAKIILSEEDAVLLHQQEMVCMRHFSWPTLLLCFCIAVVSFDRVPDPPAANQSTIRTQGVHLDVPVEGVRPVHVFFVPNVPHSPARWLTVCQVNPRAVETPKLMRRASDPSPPNSTI